MVPGISSDSADDFLRAAYSFHSFFCSFNSYLDTYCCILEKTLTKAMRAGAAADALMLFSERAQEVRGVLKDAADSLLTSVLHYAAEAEVINNQ